MGSASHRLSVFDQEEFLERLGGDYELGADVARLFLDDCPRRISAMRDAVDQHDVQALRTAAHGLKGSAGNMSAHLLCALVRELEDHARTGRLDDAMEMMARVSDEADAVLEAVRSFEAVAAAVQ